MFQFREKSPRFLRTKNSEQPHTWPPELCDIFLQDECCCVDVEMRWRLGRHEMVRSRTNILQWAVRERERRRETTERVKKHKISLSNRLLSSLAFSITLSPNDVLTFLRHNWIRMSLEWYCQLGFEITLDRLTLRSFPKSWAWEYSNHILLLWNREVRLRKYFCLVGIVFDQIIVFYMEQ